MDAWTDEDDIPVAALVQPKATMGVGELAQGAGHGARLDVATALPRPAVSVGGKLKASGRRVGPGDTAGLASAAAGSRGSDAAGKQRMPSSPTTPSPPTGNGAGAEAETKQASERVRAASAAKVRSAAPGLSAPQRSPSSTQPAASGRAAPPPVLASATAVTKPHHLQKACEPAQQAGVPMEVDAAPDQQAWAPTTDRDAVCCAVELQRRTSPTEPKPQTPQLQNPELVLRKPPLAGVPQREAASKPPVAPRPATALGPGAAGNGAQREAIAPVPDGPVAPVGPKHVSLSPQLSAPDPASNTTVLSLPSRQPSLGPGPGPSHVWLPPRLSAPDPTSKTTVLSMPSRHSAPGTALGPTRVYLPPRLPEPEHGPISRTHSASSVGHAPAPLPPRPQRQPSGSHAATGAPAAEAPWAAAAPAVQSPPPQAPRQQPLTAADAMTVKRLMELQAEGMAEVRGLSFAELRARIPHPGAQLAKVGNTASGAAAAAVAPAVAVVAATAPALDAMPARLGAALAMFRASLAEPPPTDPPAIGQLLAKLRRRFTNWQDCAFAPLPAALPAAPTGPAAAAAGAVGKHGPHGVAGGTGMDAAVASCEGQPNSQAATCKGAPTSAGADMSASGAQPAGRGCPQRATEPGRVAPDWTTQRQHSVEDKPRGDPPPANTRQPQGAKRVPYFTGRASHPVESIKHNSGRSQSGHAAHPTARGGAAADRRASSEAGAPRPQAVYIPARGDQAAAESRSAAPQEPRDRQAARPMVRQTSCPQHTAAHDHGGLDNGRTSTQGPIRWSSGTGHAPSEAAGPHDRKTAWQEHDFGQESRRSSSARPPATMAAEPPRRDGDAGSRPAPPDSRAGSGQQHVDRERERDGDRQRRLPRKDAAAAGSRVGRGGERGPERRREQSCERGSERYHAQGWEGRQGRGRSHGQEPSGERGRRRSLEERRKEHGRERSRSRSREAHRRGGSRDGGRSTAAVAQDGYRGGASPLRVNAAPSTESEARLHAEPCPVRTSATPRAQERPVSEPPGIPHERRRALGAQAAVKHAGGAALEEARVDSAASRGGVPARRLSPLLLLTEAEKETLRKFPLGAVVHAYSHGDLHAIMRPRGRLPLALGTHAAAAPPAGAMQPPRLPTWAAAPLVNGKSMQVFHDTEKAMLFGMYSLRPGAPMQSLDPGIWRMRPQGWKEDPGSDTAGVGGGASGGADAGGPSFRFTVPFEEVKQLAGLPVEELRRESPALAALLTQQAAQAATSDMPACAPSVQLDAVQTERLWKHMVLFEAEKRRRERSTTANGHAGAPGGNGRSGAADPPTGPTPAWACGPPAPRHSPPTWGANKRRRSPPPADVKDRGAKGKQDEPEPQRHCHRSHSRERTAGIANSRDDRAPGRDKQRTPPRPAWRP